MKKPALLLALSFSVSVSIFAQLKHDNIWTIGFRKITPSPNGYPIGGIVMNFNDSPPSFMLQDYIFDRPKATISDKKGQLVAYTNGCVVVNRNHELMVNGDTLNPGNVFLEFCENGDYPLWQPTIFLPKPGSDSLYYLFHIRGDDYSWDPINLMYSVIDASGDAGNGAVITKNNSVLSDSTHLGDYVTATRHANGRDWWVVVSREFSNNMHVTLLTPDTVEYKGMQDFDYLNLEIDNYPWGSQTAFSADGSKYFRNSPKSLLVLDFDRCTGQLSNPVRLDWDSLPFGGGGVAVSPNSRFLYLSSGETVQQYDLWNPDLAASMQEVAQYDGFLAPGSTKFFQMMPGPDGKIYMVSTSDSKVLHVIHNPNVLGLACNVEQHAITLPARTSVLTPNFANYNLGPLDGSTCDTLGLNNLPVARFQWNVEDTLSPMQIAFTDYSYHTPTSWHWDFGDGSTSQDTSPVHTYALPGAYEVCLTVSNAYAADTFCRQVLVGISGIHELPALPQLHVYPNPFSESVTLQLPAQLGVKPVFELSDLYGRLIRRVSLEDFETRLDLKTIPAGVYVWQLYWNGMQSQGGKLVKVE